MNLTLDANIWIGAVDPADSQQRVCNDFLDEIALNKGISVCSPFLMEIEVLGSVARKFHNQPDKINDARRRMRSLPRNNWFALDNRLAAEASHYAVKCRLRGADAVYVATALSNNATLVTFDQEIIDRASTALTVLKPDEWLKTRA